MKRWMYILVLAGVGVCTSWQAAAKDLFLACEYKQGTTTRGNSSSPVPEFNETLQIKDEQFIIYGNKNYEISKNYKVSIDKTFPFSLDGVIVRYEIHKSSISIDRYTGKVTRVTFITTKKGIVVGFTYREGQCRPAGCASDGASRSQSQGFRSQLHRRLCRDIR